MLIFGITGYDERGRQETNVGEAYASVRNASNILRACDASGSPAGLSTYQSKPSPKLARTAVKIHPLSFYT